MYTYSIECESIVWDTTTKWQEAIDVWSNTKLSLTCDDVAIHVVRNGIEITKLENKQDIMHHSDFLMAVQDSSNRIEGRIMMDMYEQEVNGMNVVETKDDFLDRSYGDEQKTGTHDKNRFILPTEWQEPYADYMLRKVKEETNYGIELPLTEDLSDTTTDLDFHGKFEDMDDDTQDAIINPKHYKMIPKEAYAAKPEGLEYMDLMEYILAHHEGVESHLLGQVFKYACRLGKKDAKLQDAKKIAWYANRLVTVIEKGQ
jgi:hypothetical protein